jgi:hypothetical protein
MPNSSKLFKSQFDLMALNIVDWNRLNGYWDNPAEALETLSSWFVGTSYYTVVDLDITKAPERDDFPGWEHVGGHERIGKLYWNWFHASLKGKLVFSDSPDFYGEIQIGDKIQHFWGDIGKVSPFALAQTQKSMDIGDLWISIVSTKQQVVIEPVVSLVNLWGEILWEKYPCPEKQ